MLGSLERSAHSGKILDLATTGTGIKALDIALLADAQRGADINLMKIVLADNPGGHLTELVGRADECGNGHNAGIYKQLAHFGNTADVFHTVLFRETEIAVDARTDIVAVENAAKNAALVQFALQTQSDGALAGTGKTGEPDHHTLLAEQGFLVGTGHHLVIDGIYVILLCHSSIQF